MSANEIIQTKLLNCTLDEIGQYQERVTRIHHDLPQQDFTGWLDLPLREQDELVTSLENIAQEVKACADVLVVIGIGGSFLGAHAVQEALTPYFGKAANGIEVIYAGQHMSGAYVKQLLAYLDSKQVYVNVISKSGGTMEPALAFRTLRLYMEERYGNKATERIIVTTDGEKGILKGLADQAGYRQFVIPDDVGGRFSVLTPVGLLPIAVAGVDIRTLLAGAKDAAIAFSEADLASNVAYRYAVLRHMLYEKGYTMEILASFEPSLSKLGAWWQQLFGESEGKDHKGLYPATVNFSTDLHSIGQFIQEGSRVMFETVVHFNELTDDLAVPFDARDEDGLNYVSNRTFNEVNAICEEGTILAHAEGEVPVIQLALPTLDTYHLGYLLYFFMKACGMSASLLEVNPFNQPGVEAYKKKMQALLKEDK
ncbi:glucose-6-phosphate isomerase [Lysinibacillus piscis]|uniref:Glucose-6-phosphate isomerase n=1 Tax=Lysinibacillus piscis TaxID=2518931 RepID=A0ABQ5NHM7_9BACI|nr:glucose-6-phosphate isomerase [Lysinibacillus sp. KH24]GLC87870.1 glucose-6-phosphate isomerase [Lysinibacillus sp. KH24]